ncbi:MAG: ribbon-helix-helix protein, CopG family [Elusimicrobia bacterium]|nr:ribbon-helix-helix protein, CopG family [Elusimicrobiota bacterium]
MGTKKLLDTPITILLTDAQHKALSKISKTEERSISWLIRKAIDQYYAAAIRAEESASKTDSNSTKDA